MKKIYWRPHRASRSELFLIMVLALTGLLGVEKLLVSRTQEYHREKLRAARLAAKAFDVIKQARLKQTRVPIDPDTDPSRSGLIGVLMSPVTTSTGNLFAKQTTVNPNFAAVIVHMLKKAGVEQGDVVAIGESGSFPALNICTYAAISAIGAKPVAVASASASQWGANLPGLLWIDMERLLYGAHVFRFRAVAASRGGLDDRALGLTQRAQELLDEAIKRNGLPLILPQTFTEGIDRRMAIYDEHAKGAPIKAYVNIGGGTVSVGTVAGKKMFKPGLTRRVPTGAAAIDSVMSRFILKGIPVIHLIHIKHLAGKYGLPETPRTRPPIGQGKVFVKAEYNIYLAMGVLVAIVFTMIAVIRLDWGFRIRRSRKARERQHPEPMV